MGMYTGLRFKGVVKPEFRADFESIALRGEWSGSKDAKLAEFSAVERCSFIPCGSLSYMPSSWEEGKGWSAPATDGFERTYNLQSGYWAFQCSLKNYEDTIEAFLQLLPYFIESVEHVEVFYEEWDWSERYDMVDGKMQRVTDKFVRYNYYTEDV